MKFGYLKTKLAVASLISHFRFLPSDKTPYELNIEPCPTSVVLDTVGEIYLNVVRV